MTDYQEWIAALKPGDSWHCVISIDFSGMRVARAEVIRLTNTQIVCGLDAAGRLLDGVLHDEYEEFAVGEAEAA